MFFDEEPLRKKEGPVARNLEPLSLDELAEYIGWLNDEITRTEAEIARKKAASAAAEGFFKK